MSQITNGIRSVLSSPSIYNAMQNLMGAKSTRERYMKKYFQVSENQKVLDIGCGTGEILSILPRSTEYFGYDMSENYIDFAQKKFSQRGHFEVGLVDSVLVESLPKFDWVFAMGLLHHLDDEEVTKLMLIAKNALAEGGKFVAIDPCFHDPQSSIAHWLISKDRGENVRTEIVYQQLAQKTFEQYSTKVVHQSWIPYTHNILICSNNDSV